MGFPLSLNYVFTLNIAGFPLRLTGEYSKIFTSKDFGGNEESKKTRHQHNEGE